MKTYKIGIAAIAAGGLIGALQSYMTQNSPDSPVPSAPQTSIQPSMSNTVPEPAPLIGNSVESPVGNMGIIEGSGLPEEIINPRQRPNPKYAIGPAWEGLEEFKEVTANRGFTLEKAVLRNYFGASSLEELSGRMREQYGPALPRGAEVSVPYKRSDAHNDFTFRVYFAQKENEPLENILRRALNAKINEVAQANGLISDFMAVSGSKIIENSDGIKGDYIPRGMKIRLVGYYNSAAPSDPAVSRSNGIENKVNTTAQPGQSSQYHPGIVPSPADTRPLSNEDFIRSAEEAVKAMPVPPMPNHGASSATREEFVKRSEETAEKLSNEEFIRRAEEAIRAMPVPEPGSNGSSVPASNFNESSQGPQSNYVPQSQQPSTPEPFDVTKIVNIEKIRKELEKIHLRERYRAAIIT